MTNNYMEKVCDLFSAYRQKLNEEMQRRTPNSYIYGGTGDATLFFDNLYIALNDHIDKNIFLLETYIDLHENKNSNEIQQFLERKIFRTYIGVKRIINDIEDFLKQIRSYKSSDTASSSVETDLTQVQAGVTEIEAQWSVSLRGNSLDNFSVEVWDRGEKFIERARRRLTDLENIMMQKTFVA